MNKLVLAYTYPQHKLLFIPRSIKKEEDYDRLIASEKKNVMVIKGKTSRPCLDLLSSLMGGGGELEEGEEEKVTRAKTSLRDHN